MLKLDDFRQNGRIVVDDIIKEYKEIDEYEQEGARPKFWFDNWNYLFKQAYNDSYEDYAEVIASKIAETLGLDFAIYDFATYDEKNGIVTKNFLNDEEEEFISGTEIINEVYNNYINPLKEIYSKYKEITDNIDIDLLSREEKEKMLEKFKLLLNAVNYYDKDIELFIEYKNTFNYTNDDIDYYINRCNNFFTILNDTFSDFTITPNENSELKYNNLTDLWFIVDKYIKITNLDTSNSQTIIKNLLDIFIFDALTLQGDRHPSNWGLIRNKTNNQVRLSPLFDNSNIFNLNRSSAIKSINDRINKLNINNLSEKKRERIETNLKESIYHPKMQFSVDTTITRKHLDQISSFIRTYCDEDINYFIDKVKLLNEDKIKEIFSEIELDSQIIIPDIIKNIVIKTIQLNTEFIKEELGINLKRKGVLS